MDLNNQYSWKINTNRCKYGEVYIAVLNIMNHTNLFKIKNYIDLSESFFVKLDRELRDQTVDPNNCLPFVISCLNQTIQLYELSCPPKHVIELGFLILNPVIHYIKSRPSQSNNHLIKNISLNQLESAYQEIHSPQINQINKINQINQVNRTNRVNREIPFIRLDPIHPRPPTLSSMGIIHYSKDIMDI
jgi:hypothetical protein